MASPGLFIAHNYVSSLVRALTKVAPNGTTLWTSPKGSNAFACAVDSSGNVIFGGDSSESANLWKFDNDGAEVTDGWPIHHNAGSDAILGLATDDADAVYLVTRRASSASRPIAKYAAAGGSPVWNYGQGAARRAIAVDAEGFIVSVGNETGGVALQKWTPAGGALNSTNHGTGIHLYAVACPGTGIVAAGNYNTSDSPQNSIRRYAKASFGDNFNSTALWKRDYLNAQIRGVAVDADDNIYVVGLYIANNGTLKKYNNAGTLQWSADHGADTWAVVLDEANGHVYIGGNRAAGSGNVSVRKYRMDDGTEITTGNWPLDLGTNGHAYALAWWQPPVEEAPGVPLPLAVGLPLGTFGHTAGGILAPLGLALPTVTQPPLPPIAPARTVYELWIGVGSDAVRLPMMEFQCRRRRNDSTWLSIRLSGIDRAATLRAIVGKTVHLYAGDGATMGEFLRATLTAVDDEQGAWNATTTLTCRAAAPADPLQTRSLAGIEKIVIDNGRHFVRCNQVDFRLRPGDYAVADGETFLVYGVNYRVGAGVAMMDVRETP